MKRANRTTVHVPSIFYLVVDEFYYSLLRPFQLVQRYSSEAATQQSVLAVARCRSPPIALQSVC